MPRRNSPKDIETIEDLNRLDDIVHDKRNAKRANEKKTRRNRHYQKQFIKNSFNLLTSNTNIMNTIEIIEKLKMIIKPFVKNDLAFGNLTESTDFITDLQINSANIVDIILDVEDAFEIIIDNDDMTKMINVKNTVEMIESKIAAKS